MGELCLSVELTRGGSVKFVIVKFNAWKEEKDMKSY